MKLSKTSTQAALALTFLAVQEPEPFIQARQVGVHLGIPTDSALKILQALARQGLIQSQLGRAGGYRLGQPADRITLATVIEAMDGSIHSRMRLPVVRDELAHELSQLQSLCDRVAQCLVEHFTGTTIADLCRVKSGVACVPPSDAASGELDAEPVGLVTSS